MKLLFSGFIIFAALITSAPRAVQSQSTTGPGCLPQQRRELILTAVDTNGSVIDSLRAEHLRLNIGSLNAPISDLAFHNNDQPLDLVVLIDASVSQEGVLPLTKAGAESFISSVATTGRDRVAVVSFSSKPITNPVFTSDLTAAIAAIEQIKTDKPPGYVGGGVFVSTKPPTKRDIPGSTALWDVIQSTAQTLFDAKVENRRRALLLFSDGDDTSSSSTLNALIRNVSKHDVSVFAIGLADHVRPHEGNLKKLSEQTGGIAGFPRKKEVVEPALTEIAKRVRAYYVIGYCGEFEGRVVVEVSDPEISKMKPVLAYRKNESQ